MGQYARVSSSFSEEDSASLISFWVTEIPSSLWRLAPVGEAGGDKGGCPTILCRSVDWAQYAACMTRSGT
jgi:hypothetical protein